MDLTDALLIQTCYHDFSIIFVCCFNDIDEFYKIFLLKKIH